MADSNTIDKLREFIKNKGLLNKIAPPKQNEPFYEFYIESMFKYLDIEKGDKIKVTCEGINEFEGVLLSSVLSENQCIQILTSGKKIWKSKQNIMKINMRKITNVKLIQKSFLDADDIDLEEQCEIEPKNDKKFKSHFNMLYSGLDSNETYNLCIHSSLYCPFDNADVIKGHISIITKNNEIICLDNLKLKHITPNDKYFNLCSCEACSEYVIVPFDTKTELDSIRCINTYWTVLIEDSPVHIFESIYPKFKHNKEQGQIYNIVQNATFLDVYYDALTSDSMFSGALYSKYDVVGVLTNEHSAIDISGDLSKKQNIIQDIILSIHKGSLTKIIMSLYDVTHMIKYIEVYSSDVIIQSSNEANPETQMEKQSNPQFDFSKLHEEGVIVK